MIVGVPRNLSGGKVRGVGPRGDSPPGEGGVGSCDGGGSGASAGYRDADYVAKGAEIAESRRGALGKAKATLRGFFAGVD